MTVGQVPPVPPAPAPKKTNIWMWLGIGCGVILLLGLGTCFAGGMFLKNKIADMEKNPARAAAELAVRMNPDVELVASDDTTMTIRNKQTGEEITVDFEKASEGKFGFETAEGEVTIDADAGAEGGRMTVTGPDGEVASYGAGGEAPDWLPAYPGGEVAGTFHANTAEGRSGAFTVTTKDAVPAVMAFYEQKLAGAGFKVEKMTYEGESAGGMVNASTEDGKRTVVVMLAAAEGGGTQATVTYGDKP